MVNGTGRQPTVPKRNADDPDHTSYGHRIPSGGSAGEMKGNHGSGYHTTSVGASTATPLELTPRQLTLLDLAAKCPDSYLGKISTVGAIRDTLIDRGIIPTSRRSHDALRSYSEQERAQLETALRFEWAEMMLSHLDTLAITRPHIPRR